MAEKKLESEEEIQNPNPIDEHRMKMFVEHLRNEQNFPVAVLAGALASLLGAFIWAGITALTKYQIGFMAIGVGFLVGYSIRYFGKGIDKKFGFTGALLALAGCVLGNFITIIMVVSNQEGIPFFDLISVTDYRRFFDVMKDSFQFMDVIFYGIAIFEGYRLSFLKITEDQLLKLQK